jgi:glycosyltransferase involved in cell wall biosynthesis
MKVALVHDYLKEPGGAEAVLVALKEMYPEADVYTAYKFPKYWGRNKSVYDKWDIRESWGKYLPFLPKWLSYYTILSPLFFTRMDLSVYDLVIVSQTGGYFPNGVKIGPRTKLVTYCHTPPRFLYGYDTASLERNKWYWRPISALANHILRMVDFEFAQRPHVFIANSKNVANRIWKFYRRKSVVVYPPIFTSPLTPLHNYGEGNKRGEVVRDYFLIISRIVGSKNIELAVEAANKYKFKLKIAGRPIGKSGEEILKKISGSMVEYLGEVDVETKTQLLSDAKAFLALEKDADFGMTAVEPQVYGTPVIAFRNGGYLEAIKESESGIFFDELTPEGLWRGIERFNKLKWDKKIICKNAERFSLENFKKGIREVIKHA